MGSVFISHSWSDKPLARNLAETIRKFAIHVWLDEAEIKIGDSLIEKIRAGIDQVDYVLALLSPQAVVSEWVKRELDIAINDEIEGKRVKVLPILAAQCTLPGFLKGKMYADMSTPKRFKQALPTLLDRLGVSADILSKMASAKSIDEVTKHSRQALRIANSLNSTDLVLQYETLKSMKPYEHQTVVLNPEILDALFSLLNSACETHIRLECLRVIGFLEDSNFSDKVEPLIDDENLAVATRAISTLAQLKSTTAWSKLLAILRSPHQERLHDACVDFFSTVTLNDDGKALSAASVIDEWRRSVEGDPGMEIRAFKAMCRQFDGTRDSILLRILSSLEAAAGEGTRLVILEAIKEYAMSESLWFRRIEVRMRLRGWLEDIIAYGNPSEAAIACIVALLWYEFPNEIVLKGIKEAPEATIHGIIDEVEIEGLSVSALFENSADIVAFIDLIDDVQDKALRSKLLDFITELDSEEVLHALVRHNYEPKGWEATAVLESLAKLGRWNKDYDHLLDVAVANGRAEGRSLAVSLLAQLRSGRIFLDQFLKQFPAGSVATYGRDRLDIVKALNELMPTAPPGERNRLKKLVMKVSSDLQRDS